MTTRPAASAQGQETFVPFPAIDRRGIDDIKAALNQPLDYRSGNTFIRQEDRHGRITQAESLGHHVTKGDL